MTGGSTQGMLPFHQLLCLCACAGPAAAQYFDLLQEQVADQAVAAHLVAHDLLSSTVYHIMQHVRAMVISDYGCGFEVQHLVSEPVSGRATDALVARLA